MDKCIECGSENIEQAHPENCSCHISPPCSSCTDAPIACKNCGHREKNELHTPNYSKDYVPMAYKTPFQRLAEMDGSKFDFVSMSHTHFSMKKCGRYPEGMTEAEVEKEVRGTFGGRFDLFSEGHFTYIAYTD